mmetsp:Transcript_14906/g.22963  ORF Transcript_14906/g.22963 Transcript_14906/m.22963 type:complete len:674 (+) Transcript_14906:61-2082(+)
MNEVIDLVDDVSSFVGSSSSPSSPMRKNRKRRLPTAATGRNTTTTLTDDNVIDLEASSSPSQNTRGRFMTVAASNTNNSAAGSAAGSGVIDLEAASPLIRSKRSPRRNDRTETKQKFLRLGLATLDDDDVEAASSSSPFLRSKRSPRKTARTSNKTKLRFERMGLPNRDNDSDDDDSIIEILSPEAANISSSVAAASRAQKSPLLYDLSKSTIDRIREVFPLVSSQKVQSFLQRASSYVDKGDDEQSDQVMMQIVMTVLSEYPLGETIPDEAFAAAAVGGHIDASASTTTTSEQCDDDGKVASSATGKHKIAQLECNCCFVDYPFEEMVSCRSAGHLFCKTCLQKHTEQRVFGLGSLGVKNGSTHNNNSKNASKALEILCMHSSGCTSGFHEGQLRKALSEKVLKKYDEMQYAAVIEQANTTGDISRCPKCNFIAFAEKTVKTFHCPQCSFKSCRECGEEAHPGIKCDEVESKTETDGRKNVEEAMTQALVRTCPRPFCRKKFLKTDGCNKMTCACGAFVCYVCRQEIPKNVAYAHFCQTPHCNHKSCGKCALYADLEKEDEKRVKEAAKKAAKKQKTDVDVESLLKNPNPPAAARGGRGGRGGGGHVPGHGNQFHQQIQQARQQAQQNLQRAQQINQQLQQHFQHIQAQQRRAQQGGREGGNNGRRRNGGRR